MLVPSLTFILSGIGAFLGQLLMYFAKTQEAAPAWLNLWGYVFLIFAAIMAIVTVVEFFKSIARAIRRMRGRRRGRR